jgi:hypothetical protein
MGTDVTRLDRDASRALEGLLSGDDSVAGARPFIAGSWQRSQELGVDPDDQLPPIRFGEAELEDLREGTTLASVLPVLRHHLGGMLAADARHVLVVADAEANVLWLEGHPRVRRAAEDIHFVEGVMWSERGAGTNAIGTAAALERPVQVVGGEHFVRNQRSWWCSAAPIRHPGTGALLGVVDLSGSPLETAHPLSLALVATAARLAEQTLGHALVLQRERLRTRYLERLAASSSSRTPSALVAADGRVLAARPPGWLSGVVASPREGMVVLPDGTQAVAEALEGGAYVLWRVGDGVESAPTRLRLHGHGATLRDRSVALTPRQRQLLALLALSPEGLTGTELALALYGESGKPVSARAEVFRLRALLGRVVASKPYRLLVPVEAPPDELAGYAAGEGSPAALHA